MSGVLSIQSEVIYGHVGNAMARFALQRLGREVLGVPTVLFSNHPGYRGAAGETVPAGKLAALIQGLESRGFLDGVAAVLSGYLGEAAQAEVVREAVLKAKRRDPRTLYLFDPVFGDEGGAYAAPGVAEAMARHLAPLADVVTPNRFELASLTSRRIDSVADAVAAARSLGRPLVVATSVPDGRDLATVAVGPSEAFAVSVPRIDMAAHGTGDLTAALFLARRLEGRPVAEALSLAASSVDALVRAAGAGGLTELPLVAMQGALVDPPVLLPAHSF